MTGNEVLQVFRESGALLEGHFVLLFSPPQQIAHPPVLSMCAGLAADADRREARGGAGRESSFVGSGDGCLPRYGRAGARPGSGPATWRPVCLCREGARQTGAAARVITVPRNST